MAQLRARTVSHTKWGEGDFFMGYSRCSGEAGLVLAWAAGISTKCHGEQGGVIQPVQQGVTGQAIGRQPGMCGNSDQCIGQVDLEVRKAGRILAAWYGALPGAPNQSGGWAKGFPAFSCKSESFSEYSDELGRCKSYASSPSSRSFFLTKRRMDRG